MFDITFFADPTTIAFGQLFLAMFLGAVLGTERSVIAGQPAGMRTFGLVSLGSCLVVMAGSEVHNVYLGAVNFEPAFVMNGIITGVGFLGAGVIIFRGNSVHGVTTAAGIWVASALGMAVGFGLYAIAVFTTLLTLLMFTGMWYVENRFRNWFLAHNQNENGNSSV